MAFESQDPKRRCECGLGAAAAWGRAGRGWRCWCLVSGRGGVAGDVWLSPRWLMFWGKTAERGLFSINLYNVFTMCKLPSPVQPPRSCAGAICFLISRTLCLDSAVLSV